MAIIKGTQRLPQSKHLAPIGSHKKIQCTQLQVLNGAGVCAELLGVPGEGAGSLERLGCLH